MSAHPGTFVLLTRSRVVDYARHCTCLCS